MVLHHPPVWPIPPLRHSRQHQIQVELVLFEVGHQLINKDEIRLLVAQPQQGHSSAAIIIGGDGFDEGVGGGDGR